MSELLRAALDYAGRQRLPVFPCVPGEKLPAFKGSFHHATTNPATIERWWRAKPYNIGIRTGVPSGVFIVDIDGELGAANLRELRAKHGALPATLISTTGKGWHLWFRAEDEIPCSTGKIAPGLDVRADGGYVVAPPSIHPSGAVYRWRNEMSPASAPAWLMHLAQRNRLTERDNMRCRNIVISDPRSAISSARTVAPVAPIGTTSASSAAYGHAALDREIAVLAATTPGGRNAALNCASFHLHQLVAGQELYGDEVARELLNAAQTNGLLADDGVRQVQATIRSGANAGLRFPRDRHGRR
jgi:hypothetical protein